MMWCCRSLGWWSGRSGAGEGGREFDLNLRRLFNSKERDMYDWEALIEGADERFRITKVSWPEGSQPSIEVTWDG